MTSLVGVQGGVVWGMESPCVHARGRFVVVPRPQADEDVFLSLRAVTAGVGQPLRRPWVDPCWLDILGRLVSPRVWLLYVWLAEVYSQEGSCVLMHEPSWHDDVAVIASQLLGVIATLDEELA